MAIPEGFAVLTALVPVGTGVLGYWLSGRNDEARDKRAAEREAVARREMRAEHLADERQAFQRDVLLELQDVLQKAMRAAFRISLFDLTRLRAGQPLSGVPGDIDQNSHETGIALTRMRARVLDDKLRSQIEALQNAATTQELIAVRLKGARPDEAIRAIEEAQNALTADYIACTERLGVVLRGLLAGPA